MVLMSHQAQFFFVISKSNAMWKDIFRANKNEMVVERWQKKKTKLR